MRAHMSLHTLYIFLIIDKGQLINIKIVQHVAHRICSQYIQVFINLIFFSIFQYLLKQSASSAAIVHPPLNISTDAMSLDGILDSISCGSISSPPSPANYLSK